MKPSHSATFLHLKIDAIFVEAEADRLQMIFFYFDHGLLLKFTNYVASQTDWCGKRKKQQLESQ